MSHHIPGRGPLNYSEVPNADDYSIGHIFSSLAHQAISNTGHQLVTDKHGLFILRPSYWMEVHSSSRPTLAAAYDEAWDFWSEVMDSRGNFTFSGAQTANCVVGPDIQQPSFEEHIAHKHSLDDKSALAVTSRAMWDLLMIRGLPETTAAND